MKVPAPPPSTSSAPSYGPAIDIDLDIDLGTPDNPIDDINLGRILFFSVLNWTLNILIKKWRFWDAKPTVH
jgi:hypothetical protein